VKRIPTIRFACALLLAYLPAQALFALTNNVALSPPMGWNDWNAYHCGIGEDAVTNNAGILVASGMAAAGYQYVDIDDGWAATRDSNGVIQPYSASGKFPDGIQWVANYVHGLGLKLGVYTDNGSNTCSSCINTNINPVGKDPGSYQYEYIDAFTYALWGADYLKDDNCNATGLDGQSDYGRMSDGLLKSGRPIVFCLCGGEAGNAKSYQSWSPTLGNYWRTTGDIGSTFASMISHIDPNSTSAFVAGPGRWNDPDMMELGNGEFATNLVAAQTHFTMWCIMAAPLIAGNNLTTMSAGTLAILTNAEAIAVDQDPPGEQGVFVGGIKDTAEVWSKPLGYDFTNRAVALLNRQTNMSANITCYFTNLAFQPNTIATVRDLWGHIDLGTFTNSFTATVPPYGSMLLKIVGNPVSAPAAGTNYLSDLTPIYAYTGWGTIVPNKSIGGNTITLAGVPYVKGIGVNSRSGIEYNLGGVCKRFQASIGIDDEMGANGSVIFEVFADGALIYASPPLTGSSPTQAIDLDVTGVRRLTLGVDDDNNGNTDDHADWANALVIATNSPQVPESPTGVIASSGNLIVLNWNTTLAGITYDVKRATTSGGPYTTIANLLITTFADSNVVTGTPYYYVVSAVSSIGEGSNSAEVSATCCDVPLPPANVTTASSNAAVILSWSASPAATSYAISRFTSMTPPVTIVSGITEATYTDTNASPGQVYFYLVSAANACNQSAPAPYVAGQASLQVVTPTPPVYWINTVTSVPQNWNSNANWTNSAVFPNGAGSNVVINANISAPQAINLNVPITIGALSIGDANGSSAYTISANSGSLTLNNGAAGTTVTQLVTSAGDTIAAPITVLTNLTVANNSVNPLTLTGNVSGSSLTLNNGTIIVGDGATNGSLAFNSIANQGTFIFRRSDSNAVGASISGSGGLTQNGAGVLTLSAGNSFLGPVTVAQGTLKVGASGALGATNSGTTVQSGATLDVNGISLGSESVTASGGGVNGEGAVYNSGAQITSGIRFLTLTGDTSLGGTGPWNPSNNQGRWDVRGTNNNVVSGTLSTGGHPYKLTKVGSNQVSIVAISVDPQLGDVDIQQGLMGWETVTTSMGNPSSNFFVRAGATLSFFNASTPWNKNFIFYGNGTAATVTNWSGANAIVGPVQLNGGVVFWGGGTSLTLGNVVSGTGSLIKNGSYSLILSNANTYTGSTIVNSGTLSLVGNGSIANSPNITIATGATLSAPALTLANGQTLQGNGSLSGSLTVSPGSTVAPSGAPGLLAVGGAAVLQGTTLLQLNRTAATNGMLNAAGSIVYGGTLALSNVSGTLMPGDSFKLFNATTYSGGFSNITPAIPGLNLAWNTNGLSAGVVSVVSQATPPPKLALSMGANGIVFVGSNGVPGWPYFLLASTNVGMPLSNWTPLLSNAFDANGNFIFTNSPSSNAQQFFIVQLP
jgi:alpha-galactosidase